MGLLAKHIQEGLIDSKTRWKEYLPVIEQEDATKNLCLNFSGSQPQELFYDAIEQLETLHSENSEIVARVMHMTKLSFHVSSSTETLTTELDRKLKQMLHHNLCNDKAELESLYNSLTMVSHKDMELYREQIVAKHCVKKEKEKIKSEELLLTYNDYPQH